MAPVTILHNPHCSKSRDALAAAEELGVEVTVRQYLKTPLTEAELADLVAAFDGDSSLLVRQDKTFRENGLTQAHVDSDKEVIAVLCNLPKLLQRPILIADGKAVIGRPTEDAVAFLKEHSG